MDPNHRLSFNDWERLFIRGKTKATYAALFSFVFFAITILYSRLSLFYFIVTEVGAFSSFGVLVDFVSHLFNDQWNNMLSKKEWEQRFLHGRTHDAYGIIIQIICSIINTTRYPLAIFNLALLLPEFYIVYSLRFYH